jgi:ribonuclease E
MSEMNVRSDAVDVEQIMRQIRARIREKRGADYTEAELQQLATVKLEKFLDPRGVRSDLVEQFRRQRVVAPAPPNYEFGDTTLFETHRGLLRTMRRLLRPVLKLFFNPDKITSALHLQAQINTQAEQRLRRLEEREPLSYELLHNLTLEVTRLGIEVHNLKMRVESLSSRLDFDERRSRALESVVEYRQPRQTTGRPGGQPPQSQPQVTTTAPAAAPAPSASGSAQAEVPAGQSGPADGAASGQGERRRRRRRRRRRPGSTLAETQGQTWSREPGQQAGRADETGASGDDGESEGEAFDDSPDSSDAPEQ